MARGSKDKASMGDRAVAIGGFVAIVVTGFFGAEPQTAAPRELVAERAAAQSCETRATQPCQRR